VGPAIATLDKALSPEDRRLIYVENSTALLRAKGHASGADYRAVTAAFRTAAGDYPALQRVCELARSVLYPPRHVSDQQDNRGKAMNKMLASLAISLTAVAFVQAAEAPKADTEAKAPAYKAHSLTAGELDKLLATPERVLVIDVRRPDEVSAKGGFPVYLSVQFKDLENELKFIPKDRTIVTVSNHAARAGKAADLLVSKGFKVAGAAGSETYEQAGGKAVVHIPVPAPKTADAATAK
jgi:rhodanese-related sulfurtransferase